MYDTVFYSSLNSNNYKHAVGECKRPTYSLNVNSFGNINDIGNHVGEDDGNHVGDSNKKVKLNKTERKVWENISNEPDTTITELALRLEVATRTVERSLASLKSKGYITRIGSNRTGYWHIIR